MSSQPQSSRIYFSILEKLKDPNDPIGMFAYAIYKRQKMDERERLEKLYNRPPTNEEMNNFVLGAETRIDDFLKLAEIQLADFQDALVGQHINDLSEQYNKKYLDETKKFQPQKPPSWIKQIFYGIGGNIATALISFVLFAICVAILEGWPSLSAMLIKMLQKFTQPT